MKKNIYFQFRFRTLARHMGVVGLVFLFAVSVVGQNVTDDSAVFEKIWRTKSEMMDPDTRAEVVSQLEKIHRERRDEANAQAKALGLPLRELLPDETLRELMGWGDGRPIYYTTLNADAAISTGANLLRLSPYEVDGSGWTVGVWDATGVLTNHQEFLGRATVKDLSYTGLHWHSTHVAGTIGATGVSASAMGMARAVHIDSYDWNDDTAEMVSRGASIGGEPGMIYLSNHSYGMISGWFYTGAAPPAAKWEWYGSGTTSTGYEPFFGQYNAVVRDTDSWLHVLPYYLSVWAAGNDRDDNPALNNKVALSPGGTVVDYNSALHPSGDGNYRNGYDNIGFNGIAKNVLTIGAVNDAVTGGQRDIAKAAMLNFSSWGPADDGRIKPDLVANGWQLESSHSDGTYSLGSGTSMAAPNATGTAQLLLSLYGKLVPGQYLRASTLKGLLIHTADDLGTPGPDYQSGWGLINGKEAANLIFDVATNSATLRMVEQKLTSSVTSRTHVFTWDGVSPIRATLCWTDPAGPTITSHDSRTATLVNNLNLRIEDPDGSSHFPFVMPFVGTWTTGSLSLPATTGTNVTDNVEQVRVASPSVPGRWKAVVSVDGALAGGLQHYSLLLSGSGPARGTLLLLF